MYKVSINIEDTEDPFVFEFDTSAEAEAFCDATMRVGFSNPTEKGADYYTSRQVTSIEKEYDED